MKDITPGVKALIDKINSEETTSPDSILDNVINLMRIYSMEQNSMELSEVFVITQDGKFSPVPIKPKDMRGDFGDMLMAKYISEFKKEIKSDINSLVEFNFGHGIALKIKESEYEKEKERLTEIENKFKQSGAEALKDEPEYQDYFVVNIMKKDNINTKIYDIIKADDNSNAFVISNKPTIEHDVDYSEAKLTNYLKD